MLIIILFADSLVPVGARPGSGTFFLRRQSSELTTIFVSCISISGQPAGQKCQTISTHLLWISYNSLKSDGIMNSTMKQIPVKNNNAWPFLSHLITRWTFPRKVRRTKSEGRCYNPNSLKKSLFKIWWSDAQCHEADSHLWWSCSIKF